MSTACNNILALEQVIDNMSTAFMVFLAQEVVTDNMSTAFMVFLAQEVVTETTSIAFIDISMTFRVNVFLYRRTYSAIVIFNHQHYSRICSTSGLPDNL